MAKRLSQEFAEFLQLCSAEGVRFVVIGGQAIIFYGRVRATLDLDVLVAPTRANAAKVARVIARFAAPFAGPYDFAKPDTGVRIGPDAGLHIDVTNSIDGIQTKTYFPIPAARRHHHRFLGKRRRRCSTERNERHRRRLDGRSRRSRSRRRQCGDRRKRRSRQRRRGCRRLGQRRERRNVMRRRASLRSRRESCPRYDGAVVPAQVLRRR